MLLFFLIIDLVCRGFADSIFGMSVVFAAIVMYDAQVHCLFVPELISIQYSNLFNPLDQTSYNFNCARNKYVIAS